MTIKYYRKKGTKEATHQADFRISIGFGIPGIKTEGIFYDQEDFNQFLKDNGYEEVLVQSDIQEKPVTCSSDYTSNLKLPVVGKPYKDKRTGRIGILEEDISFHNKTWKKISFENIYYRPELFWERFEECPNLPSRQNEISEWAKVYDIEQLPEENKPTDKIDFGEKVHKPNLLGKMQLDNKMVLSKEVREAMNEMKWQIKNWDWANDTVAYKDLLKGATNLIKVLEESEDNIEKQKKEVEEKVFQNIAKLKSQECDFWIKNTEDKIKEIMAEKGDCGIVGESKKGYSYKFHDYLKKEDPELSKKIDQYCNLSSEPNKQVTCEDGNDKDVRSIPSIWKPVSELKDQESCNIFIKWEDEEILPAEFLRWGKIKISNTGREMDLDDSRLTDYCKLTDFFSDYEMIKKKQAEMEKMITSLVNIVFKQGKITEKDIDWTKKVMEGK